MRSCFHAALGICLVGCAQGGFQDAGTSGSDGGLVDAADRLDAGPIDGGTRGADAGFRLDAGIAGDATMTSTDAGTFMTCPPTAATVEITEVMVASRTGADDRGEWFEVRNLGDCPINLAGVEIRIGGGTHVVESGLLTAGGYFLFAQSSNPDENHELPTSYAYGTDLRMPNSGGSLVLALDDAVLAQIAWGSTNHRTGSARQLHPGARMTSSLGEDGWCDATTVYSTLGGTFAGTPRRLNEACP